MWRRMEELLVSAAIVVLFLIPAKRESVPEPVRTATAAELQAQVEAKQKEERIQHRIAALQQRYNANVQVIERALKAAEMYAYKDFPKQEHLVAIIGIESGWRPNVHSSLASDQAYGLTQVRLNIWRDVIADQNMHDVDTQVKIAAYILHEYYKDTKHNPDSAVIAYNVGITELHSGATNWNYLAKFKRELKQIRKTDTERIS